jgi:hypothetical protein
MLHIEVSQNAKDIESLNILQNTWSKRMNLKTSMLFIAQKLHIWARVFPLKSTGLSATDLYITQPTMKKIQRKVETESQQSLQPASTCS